MLAQIGVGLQVKSVAKRNFLRRGAASRALNVRAKGLRWGFRGGSALLNGIVKGFEISAIIPFTQARRIIRCYVPSRIKAFERLSSSYNSLGYVSHRRLPRYWIGHVAAFPIRPSSGGRGRSTRSGGSSRCR